jgi:hypothetical protein
VTDARCDHFWSVFDLEHDAFEELYCDGVA